VEKTCLIVSSSNNYDFFHL